MSKHTTHDIENEGSIGMDLTYCGGCGLEAEDCKCDEALVVQCETTLRSREEKTRCP